MTTRAPLRRYTRTCCFCGGPATVLAPRGSDALDVEAEFASAARAFSSLPDGDTEGFGCYRCSVKARASEVREYPVTNDRRAGR